MSGIQFTYTFTNEYTTLIDRIITEVYLYPSSNTSYFKPLKLKALWDTGGQHPLLYQIVLLKVYNLKQMGI